MRKKDKREQLVEQNLELARQFLLEVVRHPQRIAHIPENATLILYPVPYHPAKAA